MITPEEVNSWWWIGYARPGQLTLAAFTAICAHTVISQPISVCGCWRSLGLPLPHLAMVRGRREKERERQRNRERQRQTDRQTDRDTERQKETERERN